MMRSLAIIGLLLSLCAATGWAAQSVDEPKPASVDFQQVVQGITTLGDQLVEDYTPESGLDIADEFSELYFGHFEESGMEMAIGLADPSLKSSLESQFSQVIGQASRGKTNAEVKAAWLDLKTNLQSTANAQNENTSGSFWGLLIQSLLIILREGFEAMLVITALTTYLRRQGSEDQLKVIYYGVGLALLLSLLTAYLLTQVFQISGAGQEAVEGVTMLVAAGVLFYVSYWLISKGEAARWQAYINGKIDSALSKGSAFALGFAAFLAVYREGAETVLFYQAMAGQAEGDLSPITFGFFLGLGALVVLYQLMRSASFRLPIGLFFTLTACLLYYLSVSFAGNGVLELQEAGWIGITPISGIPTITWLGLYPTQETIIAQLVLLIPLPIAIGWWLLNRRRLATEAGVSP
jgi:high-affinity iron transporter